MMLDSNDKDISVQALAQAGRSPLEQSAVHWFYPGERAFGNFSEADCLTWVQISNGDPLPRPLSIDLNLYVVPPEIESFRSTAAGDSIHSKPAKSFMETLEREVKLKRSLFDGDRFVECIRVRGFGSCLGMVKTIKPLLAQIAERFGEGDKSQQNFVAELDTDTLDEELLSQLRELGLRGLTIRVSDKSHKPSKPAHGNARSTPESKNTAFAPFGKAVLRAKQLGFESVTCIGPWSSMLPRPAAHSAAAMSAIPSYPDLEALLEQQPDTVCIDNAARWDKTRINGLDTLAQIDDRLLNEHELLLQTLGTAGYRYIGGGAFARCYPAAAMRHCIPHLSGHHTDLIGIGLGAISALGAAYAQNHRTPERFLAAVTKDRLPVERGIVIGTEDQIRREIIVEFLDHSCVDTAAVSRRWQIDFQRRFQHELTMIDYLITRGIMDRQASIISVLPRAHLLLPLVCCLFQRNTITGSGRPGVVDLAERRKRR